MGNSGLILRKLLFSILLIFPLSGCGPLTINGMTPLSGGGERSVGKKPEFGPYLLARERLGQIRLGMSRRDFIQRMALRRLPGKEWYKSFSGGDGWLIELSRKNKVGNGDLIEEYSFGYHEGNRLVERNLVILRNGKIRSILDFSRLENYNPGQMSSLSAVKISREEENQRIKRYIRNVHLTRRAFDRAKKALAKLRVGMTTGELRYRLKGYFYRLRHGYVYFADGFLWGPKFESIQTLTGSLTMMPFGYIQGGKEVQRVLIKIVDGVISEITRSEERPSSVLRRPSAAGPEKKSARPVPKPPGPAASLLPPAPPAAKPLKIPRPPVKKEVPLPAPPTRKPLPEPPSKKAKAESLPKVTVKAPPPVAPKRVQPPPPPPVKKEVSLPTPPAQEQLTEPPSKKAKAKSLPKVTGKAPPPVAPKRVRPPPPPTRPLVPPAPRREDIKPVQISRIDPKRSGILRIESTPDQAVVLLNGRRKGRTPLVIKGLKPGEYRLAIRKGA